MICSVALENVVDLLFFYCHEIILKFIFTLIYLNVFNYNVYIFNVFF